MPGWRSSQRPFKSSYEFRQRDAYRQTDLAKFQQVEPPLARFIPTDEGLGLAQPFRQFALLQSGPQTELPKQREQILLLRAVDALSHGVIMRELIAYAKNAS